MTREDRVCMPVWACEARWIHLSTLNGMALPGLQIHSRVLLPVIFEREVIESIGKAEHC